MKVSYNILKNHLDFLQTPEKTAQDLVMHTAEVEKNMEQQIDLWDVFTGKLLSYEKVEWSEKLHVGQFDFGELWTKQIIFWKVFWVTIWETYPIAIAPTTLPTWIEVKKTKMLGITSEGMICADDELWTSYTWEWLIRFPKNTPLWVLATQIIHPKKDDIVLEIDNKAINHRPDMFSYMGVMRELCTINNKEFPYSYQEVDFSQAKLLKIDNQIPNLVKRYIWLWLSWVNNTQTPDDICELVEAAGNSSKGILVDITNYSLFYYGQPTHCFDADKVEWHIVVRFAKKWESFLALDNKTYELSEEDIVIADTKKILGLWGIIWGKDCWVSETTKNIIVESAHFPGEILRATGRRLGIRTDALNIFEKNISTETQHRATSLIYNKLSEIFWKKLEITGYNDIYPEKAKPVTIPFDLDFINNLIGREYEKTHSLHILSLLWIEVKNGVCHIPFWRKDMAKKADIAEEICRIDGFEKVIPTTPRIDVWAVVQSNMTKLKSETRNFFSSVWFFDMYNYSFVNEQLMKKLWHSVDNLIEMKNYLSEEITHMRNSLIPNLMLWIEENIRERNDVKMFELEKVFGLQKWEVYEAYHLAGVMTTSENNAYYPLQNILLNFFTTIWVDKVMFEKPRWETPPFAHSGRVAEIIIRWKKVWYICEISRQIAENFDVKWERIGCFELNADILTDIAFNIVKSQDISTYQENNFDLSIVVHKTVKGIEIQNKIKKADELIKKVELFDIYEDQTKLPDQRSLSFKIYIQSGETTLNDDVKNTLIKKIVSDVEKIGGRLR